MYMELFFFFLVNQILFCKLNQNKFKYIPIWQPGTILNTKFLKNEKNVTKKLKILILEYVLPNVGGLACRYSTLEDFWKMA